MCVCVCVCVCVLTVDVHGALDLLPLPPTADSTQQCSLVLHTDGVKGHHRLALIGADGGGQGAVVQRRPGHARHCGTVLNTTHQLVTLAQLQQRPSRKHVNMQTLNAP